MKRTIAFSALSLLVTSVAAAEPPRVLGPAPTQIAPVKPVGTIVPTVPVVPLASCPGTDPAATAIDFSLASRTGPFTGNVRIVGKVKNLGASAWQSSPTQQYASLYETAPGGRPRLLARSSMQNLAPGEEISLAFVRAWNTSSPAEGEFPPSYKVVIGYDPDILLDANPRNDDCNTSNNVRERSGSEVRALFR